MPTVILCRYGELFLKGGNRGRFERDLRLGIKRSLRGLPGAHIEAPHGRVVVEVGPDDTEEACQRLERVFGLVSLSVGTRVAADIDALGAAAVALAAASATARPSFKIEARRSDKRFPLPSPEIARLVGAQVVAQTGLRVDVHTPDLRIGVEVGEQGAFVYGGARAAPGGLPPGSSGRGLLLLSGGIDSPVAGWLAAKRGLALDAIYFHSPPYIGEKSRDKVLTLARLLARWQACDSVTVIPFTEVQTRLRDTGATELAVVLYRRMMMRIADRVAVARRADALITGENLGQVASQTVHNLAIIAEAAGHIVLRPLVTYDKVDTTTLARRIGTYDTSILPYEDCCSLFVPRHPATRARLDDVRRAEARLDLDALVASAVAAAELHRLD